MKIELTKQEMYALLMAVESEAENDLRLIKKDCDFEIYTAETYIKSYLNNLNLAKKIKKALEEDEK